MKIFKPILLLLVVAIAIPLVASLFMRKEFTIERDVVIAQPKQEVFGYLKHLKNHLNFSPWASMDPQLKTDYRGTDGTVGFVSVWKSDNPDVGKSEQEISKIVEGERVDITLRFMWPFRSVDPAYFTTQAVDAGHTKVTWGYVGKMPFPVNLCVPMIESKIAKAFETGLVNLKGILEKTAK